MLPNIWIFDTYTIMFVLGIAAALVIVYFYLLKVGYAKKYALSVMILASVAIGLGILSAIGFQSLFDALKKDSTNGALAMTFYGGLVGGAIVFIFGYFLVLKKKEPIHDFKDILIIAPASITAAHGLGRIGCFLGGCCYGVHTDSWLGVTFPGMSEPVYPTQLFEAIFLLALSVVLFLLAYKKQFKYTMPIYLLSYGIWRFLIEFIRGDDRGAYFLKLSPAQWFSIVAILGSIALFVLIKLNIIKYNKKETNN